MSETRIEITGNIVVHHPVKVSADTRSEWAKELDAEGARKVQHHNEHIAPILEFWAWYDKRQAA